MKKFVAIAFSALLLVGCDDDSPSTSVGTSKESVTNIKESISNMKHHLKNNQKRFDDVYKHIGVVNKQLPKLNQQIQDQIVAQADENKNAIKKLGTNTKSQFQHLQDEINAFGKKMAAKGY